MKAFNADLHCHSTFSDGLLPPAELIRRAHANGVSLLALTDHDETGGLPQARAEAEILGLRFVNGVEISVSWLDQSVHIVGLGFDAADPALLAGLAQVRGGRDARAQRMGDALAKIGIKGVYEGALAYAGNPALVSRAHIARHLVKIGIARDVASVFDHYLVRGKPGFVEHEWASLEEALGWIHGAGGIAVIAHPGRTRVDKAGMEALFARFKDLGGEAIEVVSSTQCGAAALEFARVARRYDFLASRASDFHGPGESSVDLGRAEVLPPDLTPVWSRLV
ncbi:MAG: phosphatase [Candidatus Dactylopiibacterium carminicum]|uniref:PHP domain-containing protein n=1 Tax=Candidatus Dactylopiibacterium carminicum TaxID=857335 RepID=A0A272EV36_9RHOO|nr:3',5'-nucleoside bisphosphate phosphatase [Candidatus Dactylopiibacterium carminicum]KAF7599805.1 PHP domain-containing protein [Candidatus Dactylopiibacterium carminicum]PAS93916.1 MAG: phosphatase [Candidatus Dactylopiibacterium carminicum]PAS97232.1 MAG: phosphatase [Candidatus Dactylopiibacterium carminicum]PAS99807.1 MAG: phosphatase [Candidatus Dactylopiibacterium carminicum]